MVYDALMSSLHIRKPIAGTYKSAAVNSAYLHIADRAVPATFAVLVLASAYLGLSTQRLPQYGQSDKGLHLITFFLLTVRLSLAID